MTKSDPIQVMGRGANVDVIIDDTVPFETAAHNLRRHLYEYRGLYANGTISVNVGRRILWAEQLTGIKEILDKESGLTVSRYYCSPQILDEVLGGQSFTELAPDLSQDSAGPVAGAQPESVAVVAPDLSAEALEDAVTLPGAPALPAEVGEMAGEPENWQLALGLDSAAPVESDNPTLEADQADALPAAPALVEAERLASAPSLELAEADDQEKEAAPEETGESDWEEPPLPPAMPLYPAAVEEGPAELLLERATAALAAGRGETALIIKTTCRSGEVIRYPGDVVVLADVNPGAEIIAEGDIVVLGSLRGLAHAGAGGNLKATVIALSLEASRVQIGPHDGEAPAGEGRDKARKDGPKVAYLRRNSIFVAPFVRRREQYQGGVLYEG